MIRADTTLIEAARRGDQDAIVRLLSVCQPDLKRFARRTCSNAQDAEDAVQLALWQLYRRVGALRATAAFATWLFRIVERECWRLLRGRGRTESLDAPDAPPLNLAAAPIPHNLRMDLARAMERLSPPYRDVLILRDVHELTAPETAAQLGLSVEAVKSRLHRARAMVREHLLASGYWTKDGLPQGESAMFCSRSMGVHLLRGGAVLLMRGCPACWLMGLVETWQQKDGTSQDPGR